MATLTLNIPTTPNAFNPSVANEFVSRFEKITPDTKGNWGKMNAGQMLKHVADNAEMEFGQTHMSRRFAGRIIGRMILNQILKSDQPKLKNSPTHPDLVISGEVDFAKEKERVIQLVAKLGTVDANEFENRLHPFYGKMNSNEWGNWICKHLDHHLRQFGK